MPDVNIEATVVSISSMTCCKMSTKYTIQRKTSERKSVCVCVKMPICEWESAYVGRHRRVREYSACV